MEYVYNSFSSNYKPWVSLTCVTFENELWLIIDMRLTATKSFKGILVCKLLKTSLWFFLFFFYSIEISFTPLSILCIFFVKDYPLSPLPPPPPLPLKKNTSTNKSCDNHVFPLFKRSKFKHKVCFIVCIHFELL